MLLGRATEPVTGPVTGPGPGPGLATGPLAAIPAVRIAEVAAPVQTLPRPGPVVSRPRRKNPPVMLWVVVGLAAILVVVAFVGGYVVATGSQELVKVYTSPAEKAATSPPPYAVAA